MFSSRFSIQVLLIMSPSISMKLFVYGWLGLSWPLLAHAQSKDPAITFRPQLLAIDANEGIDLADINRDGRLDVVAGRNWYAAPEFRPRPLRSIDDWNGYVQSNGDHLHDVNGDGWTDVVAGSFLPTEVYWFENPGRDGLALGQLWKPHLAVDTQLKQNEISFHRDLDGDDVPEWICNSWNKNNPVVMWKWTDEAGNWKLKKHILGTEGHGHGMGFGDVNGDGREDILVATGWYERPAEGPFDGRTWDFHADWNLDGASCPILVRDLDGDGNQDLIWGSGHDFGLHWWRSTGQSDPQKRQYEKIIIDDRYSQAHALAWADLDGDGRDELVTGKRVRAHNGNDPGGDGVPCMYYYRWNNDTQSLDRFTIDEGHVGTGLQIRHADFDADGDVDLAVAGKDGTWLLWNQRISAGPKLP